jgi:hypothetical protein
MGITLVYKNYSRAVLLTNKYQSERVSTGDIGYIIEVYDDVRYQVEFSDSKGITIAQLVVQEDEITPSE